MRCASDVIEGQNENEPEIIREMRTFVYLFEFSRQSLNGKARKRVQDSPSSS